MSELNERQRHLVDHPEWSLVTCLNSLFNAMRLGKAQRDGRLPDGLLNSDLVLVNDDDRSQGIRVRAAARPIEPRLLLENIRMNVAATCFLQFDELARQKLGSHERFVHSNGDVKNTCSILYLARCAFAHNPLVPTWLIASRFADHVYEIPAIGLRLDTTGLHRSIGVIPKLGGWVGAVRLLQHSHQLISPTTADAMALSTNNQ